MPNIYALLIGINYYLPNLLPNGLFYNNLRGCVSDALRVEGFLRARLNVPGKKIIRLTSSNEGENKPPEPRSQWPTYENIVKAFQTITETAQPNDQVFIHYSGHGGRTRTTKAFRQLKGSKGLDEVLVPMDLGNSEGLYLRDTELHFLISKMVERGLIVTIALDSCHTGGATRTAIANPEPGQTNVRSLGILPEPLHQATSLVATDAELVKAWESDSKRNAETGSNWLLEPKGYTLLAACRTNEEANEHPFEKGETNGALTYWLVDSLKQIGPEFTYKLLHDRVLAKVHSQFMSQTPQLEGEGDRVVFGSDKSLSQYAVTVMKVNSDKTLVLNAGKAQGIWPGSRLNVFPLNTAKLTDLTQSVAVIEVSKSGTVESQATISKQLGPQSPEPGCQAVLFDVGPMRLLRRVRLKTTAEANSPSQHENALNDIAAAITRRADRFLAIAVDDDAPDYLVTIDKEGCYRIRDPSGSEIPNLKPALNVNDSTAPARVAERLVHLARYANVRELDNNDSQAVVPHKLRVELMGWQKTHVEGEKARPQHFKKKRVVKHGEWVFMRVRNKYSAPLNITVFDLQPDWGISQIYPEGADAFELIDAGKDLELPINFFLPDGYESGTDIIKVFATVEPTSFRWLELPSLDQPESADNLRGSTQLEELLYALSPVESFTRQAKIPTSASALWAAHQFEIEVQR